jgi:phosphorylated adapter RNA export protein
MLKPVYFIQNNSRRRTPGGIFLLLVKRDEDIQQEKLNLIFEDDRKKREALKKRSLSTLRKAKAEELRRSLSAGVHCAAVLRKRSVICIVCL